MLKNKSEHQLAFERQNFQGNQVKSLENPLSILTAQLTSRYSWEVQGLRLLYLHHISRIAPFFVAAPL